VIDSRVKGPILKAEGKAKPFTSIKKRSKNNLIVTINIDERES